MGLFTAKRTKHGGSTYTTKTNNVTGKRSSTVSVYAGGGKRTTRNLATGKTKTTKMW